MRGKMQMWFLMFGKRHADFWLKKCFLWVDLIWPFWFQFLLMWSLPNRPLRLASVRPKPVEFGLLRSGLSLTCGIMWLRFVTSSLSMKVWFNLNFHFICKVENFKWKKKFYQIFAHKTNTKKKKNCLKELNFKLVYITNTYVFSRSKIKNTQIKLLKLW